VLAAYVSRHGHALIDRALYLPKAWADDPARRAAAHVPEAVEFATKRRLARHMLDRAIPADVSFAWAAAG
jgi:SRSO17 transposase